MILPFLPNACQPMSGYVIINGLESMHRCSSIPVQQVTSAIARSRPRLNHLACLSVYGMVMSPIPGKQERRSSWKFKRIIVQLYIETQEEPDKALRQLKHVLRKLVPPLMIGGSSFCTSMAIAILSSVYHGIYGSLSLPMVA